MEEGIVVEVREDKVLVQPQQGNRCEGCSPQFCSPDGSGELIIEAKDPLGVKVGQRIRLAIGERDLLWYSFLLYGLPLVSLLVGAFGGSLIGTALGLGTGADVLAVGLGVGLTVLSFLKIRQYLRNEDQEQTYRPVVVEILDGKGS